MKRTIFRRVTSLFLVATIATSLLGLPAFATISDEKKELDKLQKEQNNIQNLIDGLAKDKAAIEENIQVLDEELSKISEALYNTEKKLKKVEKKIKKNEKKLAEAQASIEVQYASMKLRIQFMYENGNQEMLTLILSSESIGDFLNKAEYISELSTYDRNMLEKMKETKATIEQTQATLVAQRATLNELKAEQEQKKSDVETLVAAKQKELAAYDSRIAANMETLHELDTAIGNQQQVVEEMERIEAERKAAAEKKANEKKDNDGADDEPAPSKPAPGGYVWPLPGYTTISSGFGYRTDPFDGTKTYHSGIDLPAPSGTPIVAAASGEVAWSYYSLTAGNWIGIDHGGGVYTIYMHMSARLVSEGQKVSAGQTIGLVGTTGASTGNHLHFAVRYNGVHVNPRNYVNP